MSKPLKRNSFEYKNQFILSLKNLERNLNDYNEGELYAWQDIANNLFVLIGDNVAGSVASKVIPNLSFYPLLNNINNIRHNCSLISAFGVEFTDNDIRIILFNTTKPKLMLLEWLNQYLFYYKTIRPDVTQAMLDTVPVHYEEHGSYQIIPEEFFIKPIEATLGELIRETRNQMGSEHFTPTIRDKMQHAEGIIFTGKKGIRPLYEVCIIAIAEYAIPELKEQFSNVN